MEQAIKNEAMMKDGAHILLEALKNEGVELVFGYPGGAVLPLYDALYDGHIPNILTRHEQGAVHAAEGYAKVTGKPGVVIVTSGPGATNVVTGIADAMGDSVPLIVITGQVATPGIGKDAFQEADVIGITMPITKNNYQVRDVKELPQIIKEAFHIATTGRKGPVVIDLPKDMTLMEVIPDYEIDVEIPSYQPNFKPNHLQLKRLMDMLEKSRKPVVLAGGGVVLAEAAPELLEFVEKYQIPVVTTLLGLGAFPSQHPLHLGMGGMHGSFAANIALTDCDLLINIGSRFDDRLASVPTNFAPHSVIAHIDLDPAEIGKVVQTQIPIVADAKQALRQLLTMDIEMPKIDDWQQVTQSHKKLHPFTYDRENKQEIKPQRVVELVGELTEGDAIVVTDVGQHQMWAAQFYPFSFPKQLVTSGGLGTMGYGIPAAIGAKFGRPEKEVVLFVGDGGFQMTNQELAILNEYDLDLKVILLNNHSLGMVRQWQERFFNGRCSSSVFQTLPDFVKLTEAYGVSAVRINDSKNWENEFKQAFQQKGSVVIEVEIPASEHVMPMVPAGKPNDQMIGVE